MQQFPSPTPDAQTPFDALYTRLADDAGPDGFFERLDEYHSAQFTDGSDTLLVCFESAETLEARGGTPLARRVQDRAGVSQMTLLTAGATWFRAPAIYQFFDDLIDDGFFDDFARTIFYGAGPQGYAAAAFSVAAFEPELLLIQPQASLTPAIAGWDARFPQARRLDFTQRYGYAPRMAEAAKSGLVLFDPAVADDFAHAALFERDHIDLMRVRHFGTNGEDQLKEFGLLIKLLDLAVAGGISRASVARLLRARRSEDPYLLDVIAKADAMGRGTLARRAEAFLLDPIDEGGDGGGPVEETPAQPEHQPQSAALAKIEDAVEAVERIEITTETAPPEAPDPDPEPDIPPVAAEMMIQVTQPYDMSGGELQWVAALDSAENEPDDAPGDAQVADGEEPEESHAAAEPEPSGAETPPHKPHRPHEPLTRFVLRKAAVTRARGQNGHGPVIRRKGKRKL